MGDCDVPYLKDQVVGGGFTQRPPYLLRNKKNINASFESHG